MKLSSISRPSTSSVLPLWRKTLPVLIVVLLVYACFIAMRDIQPVYAKGDILGSDEPAPLFLSTPASEQGEGSKTYEIIVSDAVSALDVMVFGSGSANIQASLSFQGNTLSTQELAGSNALMLHGTLDYSDALDESEGNNDSIILELSLVDSSGAGWISTFVGPQSSMANTLGLIAPISVFEMGLLISMAVYGFTLFYFKRSEQYMLRYVAYVSVLFLEAALFSNDWSIAPIANIYVAIRSFSIVTAVLLAVDIAYRLMAVKTPSWMRLLLKPQAILLVGAVFGLLSLLFWGQLGGFLSFIYNLIGIIAALYGCVKATRGNTVIAATFLVPMLASANAALFGFLNLASSYYFCVFFTAPPLFNLPFAFFVMFAANKRFAQKFQEEERLAAKFDQLVEERTAELREQEAQRRQLMLNVFHDLRSPLFVVKDCAEMSIGNANLALQNAPVILERTNFMTRLTHDLFYLAKLEEGRVIFAEDAFDVKEMLQESLVAWSVLAEASEVTLCLKAEESAIVFGDELRLKEAVNNLVENAVNHSPAGACVSIELSKTAEVVVIEVRDQGPGISPEEQQMVFEQYYRKDRDPSSASTGIGLSIAYGIVTRMDGAIDVQSTLGQGSTFRVTLPLGEDYTSAL